MDKASAWIIVIFRLRDGYWWRVHAKYYSVPLLCATANQIFVDNYQNGSSQEGPGIFFPVSGCHQHPTEKSGFKIWCLEDPKESINIDWGGFHWFGWILQQLLCAGICAIPVFQVLRHRRVMNNCGRTGFWQSYVFSVSLEPQTQASCLLFHLSFLSCCDLVLVFACQLLSDCLLHSDMKKKPWFSLPKV